jgi:two-component system cell cycle sensor histidine kinase/response regulator CckA
LLKKIGEILSADQRFSNNPESPKIGINMQTAVACKNRKRVILLVDDEELILEVGTKMLQYLGYNVLGAGDGQQALDIFKKNKNNLDLVILDMNMPGMDGAAVYDKLKKIQADVRILIASGYFENNRIRKILENGSTGFIQKPFSVDVLSEKLREMLAVS